MATGIAGGLGAELGRAESQVKGLMREIEDLRSRQTDAQGTAKDGRDFATSLLEGLAAAADKLDVGDIMARTVLRAPVTGRFSGHTRGFVQVQNGCDHRCTFCVIPFGRGNSRSVPMGEVVAQVRRLV